MKNLRALILLTVLAAHTAFAGGLGFVATDTIKTVLQRQVGQVVELRLKSGEKLGGKVGEVGDKTVHLTAVTGQELFEAVAVLDDVTAVLVRAAAK